MSRITFHQWLSKMIWGRGNQRKIGGRSRIPAFEQLDQRITPSVNAFSFGGVLTVLGDHSDNTIEVSRNAAGNLLVNDGAVRIIGNAPTAANTARIQIFGFGGDDRLSLDDTNGPLPSASLYGGRGNDTLIGSAAADFLFGQAGDDMLLGKGGVDFLFGGSGDDIMTGGAAN